jgi:hypothetical protein
MTVIADNKKRVTLPTKPGERFDVQVFGDERFVLTRLEPVNRPVTVKLVRENGYTVAVGRTITQAQVRKALDEFP